MSPQTEEDYLLDYEPSVGVSESEQAARTSSPAVSLGGDDDKARTRRDEDETAGDGGLGQMLTAGGNDEEEQPNTGKDFDLEDEEDRLGRCPSRLSSYSTPTQAEIQSTNWSSSLARPIPGTRPSGSETLDPDHYLQGWQKLKPNEPRPDPEHTPYRYRLMLPFRNIAKPLRGWSGEHLTKIRQHTNLLKLAVHLDGQKRATCHLVGSQDAIRRAVDGVRRFVYVEQYDKWTAWERERLRSDDWAFFQETWMDVVKGYKLKPFSPRFEPAFSPSSRQQSLGAHSLSPSTSRRRDPGRPLSPRPASPPPYARGYGSSFHPHPQNRPRCRRSPDPRSPPPPPRNASDFDRFDYPPVFDPPFLPPSSTSFNPPSPPPYSSPTMSRLPPSVLPGRGSGRRPPSPPRRDGREQHYYDEEQRRYDYRREPGRRWQDDRGERSRRPSQAGGERRREREYDDERESGRYEHMGRERERGEERSPKRARKEEPRRAYETEAMEAQENVVVKMGIPPSAAYAFLPSSDPTSMTAVIEHRTGVSLRLQASKQVHELELVAKNEKELKAAVKLVEGEVGMVEDGWKAVLPPPFGEPTASNFVCPRSRSNTTASTSTRGPPTPSSLGRHLPVLVDYRPSPTPPAPARQRYRSTSSASPRLTRKNSERSKREERWVRSPFPFDPPASSVSPEPAEEEHPAVQAIEEKRLRSEVEAAMRRKKDKKARETDRDDEDEDAAGGVWQNGQVVGDGGKRAASAWPGAKR
ncbi:hypothetical protein JCM8097_007183 [Rhodosporidiobolus ruineniae]